MLLELKIYWSVNRVISSYEYYIHVLMKLFKMSLKTLKTLTYGYLHDGNRGIGKLKKQQKIIANAVACC